MELLSKYIDDNHKKIFPFQLMLLTQMPWLKLSYFLSLILTLVFQYRWTVVITRKFHPLIMQILFLFVPAASNMNPLRVPFIWLYQLDVVGLLTTWDYLPCCQGKKKKLYWPWRTLTLGLTLLSDLFAVKATYIVFRDMEFHIILPCGAPFSSSVTRALIQLMLWPNLEYKREALGGLST